MGLLGEADFFLIKEAGHTLDTGSSWWDRHHLKPHWLLKEKVKSMQRLSKHLSGTL